MRNSRAPVRARQVALAAAMIAAMLCGCESKQQRAQQSAVDQAKKQAAATGQAQQVVTVGKDGTTTTTLVEPPAPGQTNEAVTTTTSKPQPGQPAPPPSGPIVSAAPPPQPAGPVGVDVPAGTELAIRIDHTLSAASSHAGEAFTGEIVTPVTASDGSAVIPKGATVRGEVVESHHGGHFKGASMLDLRLTSLTVNGTRYNVATRDLARVAKGKGKRTARWIGGGSGLGMLVGGLTHGGVGLVVGGLVGGGAGTAAAGATGNKPVEIPAESVLNFALARDVTVEEKPQGVARQGPRQKPTPQGPQEI
jgi:hypothetical protein